MNDGAVAMAMVTRRIGAGYPVQALPTTTIPSCSKVTMQAAANTGGSDAPTLDPALWRNVSMVCSGTGVCDISATYVGPSDQPIDFNAGDRVHPNVIWLLENLQVTPPAAGTHWNGYACVAQIVLHQPSGSAGASNNLTVGDTNGRPFVLQQGHRIQTTTTAGPSGGGPANGSPLPASFLGQTVASLQAQIDASLGVGTVKVISVKYPSPNVLVVVEDHCGPTATTSSPFVTTDSGQTIQSTYLDLGLGQCAQPSSGTSTGVKVAAAAGGAVVLAAIAYAIWG